MDQPSINNLTFEQSLAELDRIVRELEDGQLGLEESLGRYETGVGLIKRCHAQLQAVEQRILQLTGTDGDGKPMTQPFQHSATSEMPRPVQKAPRSKVDETDVLF